jgi:hypothetical protein
VGWVGPVIGLDIGSIGAIKVSEGLLGLAYRNCSLRLFP